MDFTTLSRIYYLCRADNLTFPLVPRRSLESAGYTRENVESAHVKFQLNAKR